MHATNIGAQICREARDATGGCWNATNMSAQNCPVGDQWMHATHVRGQAVPGNGPRDWRLMHATNMSAQFC
ncbi:hypothetical protein OWR29_35785 [Actinoplanes sp. Pm04-4]|uniref:Uncharacterized protein n=1 Tax=Paractinoplanes pyxinae TaxID=2997416 RepID=A0ABT4BA42_9ACTN|nr:hypothetical protein [Actinoplanes pyxinae]MCY1143389.1 hypothetical protein [Actinoplanes pyxinae]